MKRANSFSMPAMIRSVSKIFLLLSLISIVHVTGIQASPVDGTESNPVRVMLIPADGGTEQGTRSDYEPLFQAVSRATGLHFNIRVGQSYSAVVEGMAANQVDVAFFGPVSYHMARQKGAAELLAVAVEKGESIYYSAIFVRRDSGIRKVADLRGKSVAFGDVNSTSSFVMPATMMIEAGLNPEKDLKQVLFTGSHANALAALQAGKVDAACASLNSYEKAVNNKGIDPSVVKILVKSDALPNPPLAVNRSLSPQLKKKLKDAFRTIHTRPDVKPEMIRGYGGAKVDRYDVDYPEWKFDGAMKRLARVTEELKAALIRRAAENQ